MLTIGSVVIRVRDLAAQSRFWCSALEDVVRRPNRRWLRCSAPERRGRTERAGRPPDADYVIVQDPEGNRFCVVDASR